MPDYVVQYVNRFSGQVDTLISETEETVTLTSGTWAREDFEREFDWLCAWDVDTCIGCGGEFRTTSMRLVSVGGDETVFMCLSCRDKLLSEMEEDNA